MMTWTIDYWNSQIWVSQMYRGGAYTRSSSEVMMMMMYVVDCVCMIIAKNIKFSLQTFLQILVRLQNQNAPVCNSKYINLSSSLIR